METYDYIKNNKIKYLIKDNLFKCPICESKRNNKGFLQHVKTHFFSKNLTNFIKSNKIIGKLKHLKCINDYNKKPNICLFCLNAIVANETDKLSEIKRKKFCSKSCSASFNNVKRTYSTETRKKISNSLKNKENFVKCLYCGLLFCKTKKDMKFCNLKCFRKYKKMVILTPDKLKKDVSNFIVVNGYVPSSKFNNNWSYYARKYFGTWNNMIEQLGYKPNSQKYGKKILKCKDGHIADSISEKIVDDWLFNNNIKHNRMKKYPNSNKNCDFYLTDKSIWVEYFGLAGELDEYDKVIEEKKKICLENNLQLIEIYANDLYPKNKLSILLDF